MLLPLLFGAALAGPPQLGLAVGPAVGGGESTRGTFVTVAPISAVTLGWNFGPLDSWVGVSASALMAGAGDGVVPASLLQGELGIGLGGRGLAGGIYGGNGWPGPVWGLYARGTLPRADWLHRMGLESRLFFTEATHSMAVAVMLRVEPAWPGAERRHRAEVAAEASRAQTHPAEQQTHGATDARPAVEAPPEGEMLAYPVDSPPPPRATEAPESERESEPRPEPAPEHHENPY